MCFSLPLNSRYVLPHIYSQSTPFRTAFSSFPSPPPPTPTIKDKARGKHSIHPDTDVCAGIRLSFQHRPRLRRVETEYCNPISLQSFPLAHAKLDSSTNPSVRPPQSIESIHTSSVKQTRRVVCALNRDADWQLITPPSPSPASRF
ncbi:hypothetical protein RRG08_008625 [Elysia crispata]|uniref:Uncharacterized protein n=1 Tax=Elysia crispata TaxID=231223 RepID=A0AAE1B8M3_9GAST|nr:hypothetical protein RRG08_008625 [Elysia crispata]